MLVELSELIVNNARIDFSHPKLQVIRDVLLRKPEVSIAENDKRQYLLNLRNLINDVLVSGDR
jgi:hypothetical protein